MADERFEKADEADEPQLLQATDVAAGNHALTLHEAVLMMRLQAGGGRADVSSYFSRRITFSVEPSSVTLSRP